MNSWWREIHLLIGQWWQTKSHIWGLEKVFRKNITHRETSGVLISGTFSTMGLDWTNFTASFTVKCFHSVDDFNPDSESKSYFFKAFNSITIHEIKHTGKCCCVCGGDHHSDQRGRSSNNTSWRVTFLRHHSDLTTSIKLFVKMKRNIIFYPVIVIFNLWEHPVNHSSLEYSSHKETTLHPVIFLIEDIRVV